MNLFEKRAEKHLQQKDLMKDVSLYSKIENGKALAVEEDCKKFAEVFGCEVEDLFEEKEFDFFSRLLGAFGRVSSAGKEFADREQKIVSTPICKSAKRHIEQLRKCYWLNRTRNERLKQIISSKGFRTEQEWFSYMVDEEIEKAARSVSAEQGGKGKNIGLTSL